MDLDDSESTAPTSTIQFGATTEEQGASTVQPNTVEPDVSTVQPKACSVQPGPSIAVAFPVLARTPNICAPPTTYNSILKKPTAAGDVPGHDTAEAPLHDTGHTETKTAEVAVSHHTEGHRDRKRKKDKVLSLTSNFHVYICMSISLAFANYTVLST